MSSVKNEACIRINEGNVGLGSVLDSVASVADRSVGIDMSKVRAEVGCLITED